MKGNVRYALIAPPYQEEPVQHIIHDGEDNAEKHGYPEPAHIKPFNNRCGKEDKDCIDHKGKKTQRQDVDWQGDEDQNGPDQGIDYPEKKGYE